MESIPEKKKQPKNSLPKWLKKLADESWQAELLISGLAILGSSQIPSLLYLLSDWLVVHVRFQYLWVFSYLMVYLGIASLILLLNFSIHFGLRTFWVGVVGLSSVYPDGIGPHRHMVKEYYVKDIRKNYPNLQQIINSTEKACSIIFSATAGAVMLFLGICIVILGLVLLAMLLDKVTKGMLAFDDIMTYVVGGLFACMSLLSLLNYTPLIKKPGVEKFMLKYSKFTAKLFNPLFDRSGSYLSLVFMTQLSFKGLIKYGIVYYVLIVFGFSLFLDGGSTRLLPEPERFIYESASRQDFVYDGAYLDERKADIKYFQPAISTSTYSTGEALQLSIPELADDHHWISEACKEKEVDENLKAKEKRQAKRLRLQRCASKYWEVSIDGKSQAWNPQLHRPIGETKSWMDHLILPTSMAPGKHELTIKMHRDTLLELRARIPFWIEDK